MRNRLIRTVGKFSGSQRDESKKRGGGEREAVEEGGMREAGSGRLGAYTVEMWLLLR